MCIILYNTIISYLQHQYNTNYTITTKYMRGPQNHIVSYPYSDSALILIS